VVVGPADSYICRRLPHEHGLGRVSGIGPLPVDELIDKLPQEIDYRSRSPRPSRRFGESNIPPRPRPTIDT